MISAERRVEETIRRGKSEAGLADYQARTWQGWHHHQTLSLLATWFLVSESLKGRQTTPALSVPQVRQLIARTLQQQWNLLHPESVANSATRQIRPAMKGHASTTTKNANAYPPYAPINDDDSDSKEDEG